MACFFEYDFLYILNRVFKVHFLPNTKPKLLAWFKILLFSVAITIL